MSHPAYSIIMPVRNEGKFLGGTISSIAAQTVRPKQLVIVDDGSTDDTGKIAAAATAQHDWIAVVARADRGFRQAGSGVIEAFYDGYKLVESQAFQ